MYKSSNFNEMKELNVNYGNKSNEELLFSYGFVIDHNPHEKLMLNFPLPDNPANLTNLEKLRYLFLAKQNLLPQFFLPRDLLLANELKLLRLSANLNTFKNLFSDEIRKICLAHILTEEELKSSEFINLDKEKEIMIVFINLLKEKLKEMENGTGSLEEDYEKLMKIKNKTQLRSCLIYRSVQKELARDWLEVAQLYLDQIEKN